MERVTIPDYLLIAEGGGRNLSLIPWKRNIILALRLR
jgi:hypothetical protein